MLDQYVYKNNKKMRMGYTTGSCAAAASKAAAWMLLHGQILPEVELMTPKGIGLHLEVLDPEAFQRGGLLRDPERRRR